MSIKAQIKNKRNNKQIFLYLSSEITSTTNKQPEMSSSITKKEKHRSLESMLFGGGGSGHHNQLKKTQPPPPPSPQLNQEKKIDLTKIDQTKMRTQQNKSNTKPPILVETNSIVSPEFVSEFKTSISVGADFTFNDITVQLVDDLNSSKKLFIHCLRVVPVPERSVTLKSGQIVKVDLNYMNTNGKFLKKELKREIIIPPNSDINTLESYLENGNLVIKCLLRSESYLLSGYLSAGAKNLPQLPMSRMAKLPSSLFNKSSHKLNQDLNPSMMTKQQSNKTTELDNSKTNNNSNGKANNNNNNNKEHFDVNGFSFNKFSFNSKNQSKKI